MRRLAKQSRDDRYKSNRNYQTLYEQDSQSIKVLSAEQIIVKLTKNIEQVGNTNYIAFGGFFYPSKEITLKVKLEIVGVNLEKKFKLHNCWNRIGIITDRVQAQLENIKITLSWKGSIELSLWGVDADLVNLPDSMILGNLSLSDLQKNHLSPETFYLPHDESLALEIDEEESTSFSLQAGKKITLKKCSYCGRLLPIDSNRLGALSFHKHSAKLTNHQNECRACLSTGQKLQRV